MTKKEKTSAQPWEKATIVCRVRCATLKTERRRRAEVTVVDGDGESYALFLEPGDSLDLLLDAWARDDDVLIVARVATAVRSRSRIIIDVEKIALGGLPKGTAAY